MNVKNWVQMTLADYPQKIAASLFAGGCNFRCPNCHNRDLVLAPERLPDVPLSEIWAFLEARRGLLDGVVVSGGEPTLQPDLLSFCQRVREMGYAVKLDTNGYRPSVLQALFAHKARHAWAAVDYVAMDVKAPLSKYARATGVEIDTTRIKQSVDLLLQAGIAFEFRTTVVPGLLDDQDIAEIAAWLAAAAVAAQYDDPGAVRYYLQQFVPRDTLDPAMLDRVPYPPRRLRAMADLARQRLPLTELRGI
jgi:pyruvate formate lyase activating enzyme